MPKPEFESDEVFAVQECTQQRDISIYLVGTQTVWEAELINEA